MAWLSTLAGCSYVAHAMPAVFLTSLGLGLSAVTLTLTTVHGVADEWTGVASAVVNMSQQIGAALDLAIFTTVAVSSSHKRLPDAALVLQQASSQDLVAKAADALSHGYTAAFATGATMLLAAAIVAAVAVNTTRTQASHPTSN
jgi:hypothetical protein